MRLLQLEIAADRTHDAFALLSRGLPNYSAWHAHDQGIGRNLHPFRAERAGCDYRAAADMNVIEHDRPDGYQAVIFYDRPMHDRPMADTHARTNGGWNVLIDMDDRAVLYVALVPDGDRSRVAPQHSTGPDGNALAEPDVAKYG